MDLSTLDATAGQLVAPGKGLLAAVESQGTIAKRFEGVGVPQHGRQPPALLPLFFTAPGVAQFISGIILFEETIRCACGSSGAAVWGWGPDGLGTGAQGREREGAEGVDVDYAP